MPNTSANTNKKKCSNIFPSRYNKRLQADAVVFKLTKDTNEEKIAIALIA